MSQKVIEQAKAGVDATPNFVRNNGANSDTTETATGRKTRATEFINDQGDEE
ncbi:MAG: hypothetical protein KGN33_15660 [Paracoccaceae bacterium]|nr:hypothetical protein [Paracoccaceae bacterium]